MEQHPLFKYLPKFIRSRIEGRPEFQRVLGNSGWLFADTAVRMGVGLLVGIWIARYLGPAGYGTFNYAIALVALIGSFTSLGLEGVLVREFIRNPADKEKMIGNSLTIRVLFSSVACLTIWLFNALNNVEDHLIKLMVFVTAPSLIFQSFDIFDYYFQSRTQSKYTVLSKTSVFLILTLVRVYLLIIKAPIIYFAVAYTVEVFFAAFILTLVFFRYGKLAVKPRFDFPLIKKLLKASWPLMLSSAAVSVYMRIDQIMIESIVDTEAVGNYSAAVKISEMWYFIPIIICNSVFPSIVQAKHENYDLYLKRLQKLYNVMIRSSLVIALIVTIISGKLIEFLYGSQYTEAANVLRVHIWAGVFVFWGVASSRFLIIEDLEKLSFYRTLAGALVNIILNFILIPPFGILGAAVSTLVAYAMTTLLLAFSKKARISLILLANTLNFYKTKKRIDETYYR